MISQYVRQASYLECRLTGKIFTVTAKCDCEDILDTDNPLSSENPLQKGHTHLHPDNFFSINNSIFGIVLFPIEIKKIEPLTELLPEGFPEALFHPPSFVS